MNSERIEELERQIAELKRQWPAHSVSPTMLQRLDELEEELEREQTTSIRPLEDVLSQNTDEEKGAADTKD